MVEREVRRKKVRELLSDYEKQAREKWADSTEESLDVVLNTCMNKSRAARAKLLSSSRAVVALGQAFELVRDDLNEDEREEVLKALDFQRQDFVDASEEFARLEIMSMGLVGARNSLFPK
nr:hypothetical protein MFMH1_34160 [Myxococcus sp. MH1]